MNRRRALAAIGLFLAVAVVWPAERQLPVIERPARGPSRTLALLITGDGGWTTIDREIADELNAHGVSVVGLSSLRYFWRAKTAEVTAADVTRLLRSYVAHWHAGRLVLIGYSRGADVMPFVVNRLPVDLRQRIALVALLGLEPSVGFELHLWDLVHDQKRASDLEVAPEAFELDLARVMCVAGRDEAHSLCPQLQARGARIVLFDGGHHFAGRYREIARTILAAL